MNAAALGDVIVADSSLLYVLIWAIFGLVGLFLGMPKNRPGLGLAFGLIFGILGWIIIGCSKPLDDGERDGLRTVFLLMVAAVVGGVALLSREMMTRQKEEDRRREIAERNEAIRENAVNTAARVTPRPRPGDWMWKRDAGNPLNAPAHY